MKIALLLTAMVLCGCSERWEGLVYPSKNDPSATERVGIFETLEDCRKAVRTKLDQLRALSGPYACGPNCDDQGYAGGGKLCNAIRR